MGNLCGAPASNLPNPNRIDLSHFDLMKVVGKGGFGKVNALQRKSNQEILALKRMAKSEVIKKESHIRMVWIERNIMAKFTNSPFLLPLIHAFQTDTELFFIMEFMRGGDLRYHLKTRGNMSEEWTAFYTAEILLGLEDMHNRQIVYRDLKPENILLDENGHLRISDYGLAVELSSVPDGLIRGSAGTAGYLAPEACAGEFYSTSPDCFAFGVVIYELLHGKRPFKHRTADARAIRHIRFLPNVSNHAKSLIKGLLSIDPNTRLGTVSMGGWAAVKNHPFFHGIDWNALKSKSLPAPIQPDITVANCSNQADLADQLIDAKPQPIKQESQIYFDGFDFNTHITSPGSERLEEEINHRPRAMDGKVIELHSNRQENLEENGGSEPSQSVSVSVSRSQSVSPMSTHSSNMGGGHGNDQIMNREAHSNSFAEKPVGNLLSLPGSGGPGHRNSHSQQL